MPGQSLTPGRDQAQKSICQTVRARQLVLALLLTLSVANGQESFFGVSLDWRPNFAPSAFTVGAQAGVKGDMFMGRIGVDLPWFILSGDGSFVYRFETIDEAEVTVYLGAGADVGALIIALFGVHGNVGLEFKQNKLGVFAEYQPGYFVSGMAPGSSFVNKFRVGANVYY